MNGWAIVGLVVLGGLAVVGLLLVVAAAWFSGLDDSDPDRASDLSKVLPREVTDQLRQEQRDRLRR